MPDAEDFWTRGRKTPLNAVRGVLYGALVMASFVWADGYGYAKLNLPAEGFNPLGFWIVFMAGRLVDVSVHELGHASMALCLGFRFRSLNIGPFTIQKDAAGRRHFRFDFKQLLTVAGYMGAVPDSDLQVRSRAILVVSAGPLASLLGALSMAWACLNLRGTSWEHYWHAAALLGAIFATDFVVNLLPLGYSDGTMLLHLILWTEKGKSLYSQIRTSTVWDEADRRHSELDRVQEVELRRAAVEQVLARGGNNALHLAVAYHALGSAELNLGRLADAEQHYSKSLEGIESLRHVNPTLEGHFWFSLHQVLRLRHRVPEARRAYDNAVMGCERAKESCKSGAERTQLHVLLSVLHADHEHYELALREIEAGLSQLPRDAKHALDRVQLLLTRMRCEFGMGSPDRGLETADEAESLLRSDRLPTADRNAACQLWTALGVRLSYAGRDARAASLLLIAAELCETRGLTYQGLSSRLLAAGVLRKSGRLQEAELAFPSQAQPDADSMWWFFDERAEIQMAMGRVPEAVADFEEALKRKQEVEHPDRIEVAQREAYLAAAYFAAGRIADAEACARAACDVLSESGHHEAAHALMTLALISWARREGIGRSYFDQAMRLVADASTVERSDKAHFFEQSAHRLDANGRIAEAEEARGAAAAHWRFLGLPEYETRADNANDIRVPSTVDVG